MSCFRAIQTLQRDHEQGRGGADQRARPRMKCRSVRCREGRVLDLSASGLRLRTKARPPREGSTIHLMLEGEGCRAQVSGIVRWARKLGWSGYEVGISLLGEDGKHLFRLAYDPMASEWVSTRRRSA